MAHRDLKTDNILMSECGGEVVLTDFGCCWANSKFGFKCPYITEDVDKGGNAALMAPEVANATPGTMAKISLNSLLKKSGYPNRHYRKRSLSLRQFENKVKNK